MIIGWDIPDLYRNPGLGKPQRETAQPRNPKASVSVSAAGPIHVIHSPRWSFKSGKYGVKLDPRKYLIMQCFMCQHAATQEPNPIRVRPYLFGKEAYWRHYMALRKRGS